MDLQEYVPLAPYTTLEIGGPARFLVAAKTETQVVSALGFAAIRSLPVFILGGGSNIVVSDKGFPGLVIRVALCGIEKKTEGLLFAAAGEEWDPFVRSCVEEDLAGIECLSGIPGTVGGTPVQNVGAYGQEVAESIVSVRAIDRQSRQVVELSNQECGFAYRTSIFNTVNRERYVVLGVNFALRVGGQPKVAYPDLMRSFEEKNRKPDLKEVREAVLRIRESKSMVLRPGDPDAKSAGSFFKNPAVSSALAREVEEIARRRGSLGNDQKMPQYALSSELVKLPAAWLIDQAGFAKGYRRGRVAVSSKHTLALVNRGGASAQEILDLMREIQSAVFELFSVELKLEPVLVGFE